MDGAASTSITKLIASTLARVEAGWVMELSEVRGYFGLAKHGTHYGRHARVGSV